MDERIAVLELPTDVTYIINCIRATDATAEGFYVLDLNDIIRKYDQWRAKFPRIKPYYAMKCNDDLRILQLMAALGLGFDCASRGEIMKVMAMGVSPDRIVYANTVKPESHIRHSASVGVDLLTFDNRLELHKIKLSHPTARLLLRIRCDAAVTLTKISKKFGCNSQTEGPKLLNLAKELDLNIVGVTFYVGSGCQEPMVFRRAIAASMGLFDLGKKLGFKMDMLDVGGGFPGDKGTSIDEIANVINTALEDFFPSDDVKVIAEPGRYFSSSSCTMATRIHSKSEVFNNDETNVDHVMYYIGDGIHTSFNFTGLKLTSKKIPLPVKPNDGRLINSSVWGPTCNSSDMCNKDVHLPNMDIGDWIMYENMGAYTLVGGSTFNGFLPPKVYAFIDKKAWLLLKDKLPLNEDNFLTFTNALETSPM